MPRPNFIFHGFQFYKTVSGSEFPQTVRGTVASAYATALYVGQPVKRVGTAGRYDLSAAGEGISGVISKIIQFRDVNGVIRTNARVIPAGTTYTAEEDATMIEIIPARGHQFRVCGDDGTTTTSLVVARGFEGENADHIFNPTGGAANAALGLSGAFLDISTHAAADGQWRIRQFAGDDGGRVNNDPTQIWQQWIVEPNEIIDIPGPPSATGQ